jgi:hypothetical protein
MSTPSGSFSIPRANPTPKSANDEAVALYEALDAGEFERPDFEVFFYGMIGYDHIRSERNLANENIITLIDFRKPSTEKRLWLIDLKNNKVISQSLVAHGRNSGELYARAFSNKMNSHQSSLGFYVTGSTYIGKHGLSLKLHGLENNINDQSESRAIVVHGANYVSNAYAKKYGRIGRSYGCPALPLDNYEELIKKIADGSCLFIYYPDQTYFKNTRMFASYGSKPHPQSLEP